ncbi:hypothetical protein HYFRA_00009085 [Hymenoscyphus fraxineus]|uniref:Uncharacterized protein n=1 Tax=Hymenoscyphus fraxineus TaxID=746836 RepID=A0A9N9KVQ9_9HELO|nr:hypothetical protein HYFRA_00009085 [Hymenoscyphus fraxineus]
MPSSHNSNPETSQSATATAYTEHGSQKTTETGDLHKPQHPSGDTDTTNTPPEPPAESTLPSLNRAKALTCSSLPNANTSYLGIPKFPAKPKTPPRTSEYPYVTGRLNVDRSCPHNGCGSFGHEELAESQHNPRSVASLPKIAILSPPQEDKQDRSRST